MQKGHSQCETKILILGWAQGLEGEMLFGI